MIQNMPHLFGKYSSFIKKKPNGLLALISVIMLLLLVACGQDQAAAPTAQAVATIAQTATPQQAAPTNTAPEATVEVAAPTDTEPLLPTATTEESSAPTIEASATPVDEEQATPVEDQPTIVADSPTPEESVEQPTSADADTIPTAEPVAGGDGTVVADLGFRPVANGFSFENYGGDTGRINLTADDMRRMFGDQVCASLQGDTCILTPPAQQWMETTDAGMNGGHCEGFAALSLILYKGEEAANVFGADQTAQLAIDGNTLLQREIAYYYATQATSPTADGEIKGQTPGEILDLLVNALQTASDTYTMGIYQRGFKGGHAITPYEVIDKGNGLYDVMVYDNNYPGLERVVEINKTTDTWNYHASTNPSEPESLYEGDADSHTLTITATKPRLEKQVCDFCESTTSTGGNKSAAPEPEYNQLWLDGAAHLLITTADGKRTGYADGAFLSDIPGVMSRGIRSAELWKDDPDPVYYVPVGVQFTLTVDGSALKENSVSSLTMIGPGYDLAVDELDLDPGEKDSLTFSPDGKSISYKTDYNESPDITVGFSSSGADYGFDVKGVDMESGGSVDVTLDQDAGRLSLTSKGNKEYATYSLIIDRIDDNGEQVFGHDDINLDPGDTAYVDYAKWEGNGSAMTMQIDHGSDGTIDDTLELTDAQ